MTGDLKCIPIFIAFAFAGIFHMKMSAVCRDTFKYKNGRKDAVRQS